jgi:hypothetical protein
VGRRLYVPSVNLFVACVVEQYQFNCNLVGQWTQLDITGIQAIIRLNAAIPTCNVCTLTHKLVNCLRHYVTKIPTISFYSSMEITLFKWSEPMCHFMIVCKPFDCGICKASLLHHVLVSSTSHWTQLQNPVIRAIEMWRQCITRIIYSLVCSMH